MSILSRLFKGSIRESLARMNSDVDVIQMAVYVKLLSSYKPRYGDDRGTTLAVAVSNKLFGKVSPIHSKEDLAIAEDLATNIFKTDSEIQYAALISCRARLLFEAENKTQEQWHIWDTIQWMATLHDLPSDQANPTIVHNLVTVTNIGRRPTHISHVALKLPKGYDHSHLVQMGSITGKRLTEGDPSEIFVVNQDDMKQYAKDWKKIVAQVSDSTGKVWYSKKLRANQIPSWAKQHA